MLKVCLTQKSCDKPYVFHDTGIKVFTFEELLYHFYIHYKNSMDDFENGSFTHWVAQELELKYIVDKYYKIKDSEQSTVEKYIAFLDITDYFDNDDLEKLQKEMQVWDSQHEWMKLKERGDMLLNKNEAEKAEACYLEAIKLSDAPELYNNLGVACMRQEKFVDADISFQEALLRDPQNIKIIHNTIELYIAANRIVYAENLLETAKALDGSSLKNVYFSAAIELKKSKRHVAIELLKAVTSDANEDTKTVRDIFMQLIDIYTKAKKYDEALEVMDTFPNKKHEQYFLTIAQIQIELGNLTQAKQVIEQGLMTNKSSVRLWVKLAEIYRTFDIQAAARAIEHAMSLAPSDILVQFETAKIKKEQGREKDYQRIIHKILRSWKNSYRGENAKTS